MSSALLIIIYSYLLCSEPGLTESSNLSTIKDELRRMEDFLRVLKFLASSYASHFCTVYDKIGSSHLTHCCELLAGRLAYDDDFSKTPIVNDLRANEKLEYHRVLHRVVDLLEVTEGQIGADELWVDGQSYVYCLSKPISRTLTCLHN